MTRITYVLGAGASAKALPLIKRNKSTNKLGLSEELKRFIDTNVSFILSSNVGWDSRDIDNIRDITDGCIKFGTPDLFAKFLLETGDEVGYKILKNLLSSYFRHEQEIKQCLDVRALAFLTTISKDESLPPNVRLLSWNYDSQIEIAAARLKKVRNSGNKTIKGFSCWPNLSDGNVDSSTPFLCHLNGVAGYTYSKRDFHTKNDTHYDLKYNEAKELLLSFAWEDNSNSPKEIFYEGRLEIAKSICSDTEILVIIGYSFPFFNRKIDQELFNWMKPTLKKIYFQDPFSNGHHLVSQFNLNNQIESNIFHIENTDNYFIPYEL